MDHEAGQEQATRSHAWALGLLALSLAVGRGSLVSSNEGGRGRHRRSPLGAGTAIGAGGVYLSPYRNSVKGWTEPGTVLLARRLIPKGTPGSSIGAQNLFLVRTVPKVQMAPSAI